MSPTPRNVTCASFLPPCVTCGPHVTQEEPSHVRGLRHGLALGAGVGGAVHEGVSADDAAAAEAGLALLAVHRQRPVEVAGLAVHVDVQGVEGGAAGGEGLV